MAQKEQTRQLIIAVDHLDRPVIVLDPERHIVQCNRAFTEITGCQRRNGAKRTDPTIDYCR
ncbi:PAS domain-containing protein [Escherichia coli]|nr:PAS domain-containing protein [Escherichia coli]